MARVRQLLEFNSFVGGLITEASPLTYPENSALDIINFELSREGKVSRRLGMDYEAGASVIDSGVPLSPTGEASVNTFNWNNAGGNARFNIVVVQIGYTLQFFDANQNIVSGNLIHTHTYDSSNSELMLSAAVVDGMFVVVGSGKLPSVFVYEDGVVTEETYSLKIRDLFGVEDIATVTSNGGVSELLDLRETTNINLRPDASSATYNHIYNLRNSTYALTRMLPEDLDIEDPIKSFVDASAETTQKQLPSNSDSVTAALFANADENDDRLTERFNPLTLIRSPRGNFESPTGYFVIDALERGTSRLLNIAELDLTKPRDSGDYVYEVNTLPLDKTPGGATAVGEYSGRVWYSGFSGEVIDGDSYSPRMSSYILFSKLVNSKAELGLCHQVGDPTSKESPDLLETDGGFIRIDEAYGIRKLVNVGSALIVIAENGVWAIEGGGDFGFTATTYKVSKVTDHGCTNTNSVVQVDGSVIYWGDDGIYSVGRSEIGDLVATNISNNTIQTLYDNISDTQKAVAQGKFDSYDRKVRWLYKNQVSPVEDTEELILDINLSSFYKNTISTVSSTAPNVVAYLEVPPFKVGELVSEVTDGVNSVLYDGEQVSNTDTVVIDGLREVLYLTLLESNPNITYTMSKYIDNTFVDWKGFDGVGVDSPALLITGFGS
jgi:hypothetical protein